MIAGDKMTKNFKRIVYAFIVILLWLYYDSAVIPAQDSTPEFLRGAISFAQDINKSQKPAGKKPVSQAEDSPFGVSGAFSRLFIATDDIPREEVLKMVSELKEPYKDVKDVGIRWIRPGVDIAWQLIQPTKEHVDKGLYEWAVIDNIYGRVPVGINALANIIVDQGIRPGTWKFINKEVEEKYIKFVKKLVERYDGDGIDDMPGLKNPIKYWQIENEPALIYVKSTSKSLDWQSFRHITEITYNAIKESDPEAKIAVAGMAGGHAINIDEPLLKKERKEFYPLLLQNLKGKNIDIFDIHYYGLPGPPSEGPEGWKGMKNIYNLIRKTLDKNGFKNTEIWFTETASESKPNERLQAVDIVRRIVYPLSFGVKKVFWWNMIEGEYPLEVDKPSSHFGLVYDGLGKNDLGYGVKKLSYYTYKKVIEVLEGSDWNNIQIIQESDDIYIYKFTKNKKSIYVAWTNNDTKKQVVIEGINSSVVKITEAVPKFKSGKDVKDYSKAFNTETVTVSKNKITVALGKIPLFIEEK
jgi:hypothetical protein